MSAAGYVYVLTNPALPGLLKIGKTTRTPQLRAAELSKPTGVPKPFEVAYALFVVDCHRVEKRTHQQLSRVRVRGREFFELPLCEAIATLDSVGAPYLPTAARARHRLRRILGDTLGDLVSGVGSLVWFVVRAALGLLRDVALGVGMLAAKLLLVSALLLWCIRSPPGCLRHVGSFDTTREHSHSSNGLHRKTHL